MKPTHTPQLRSVPLPSRESVINFQIRTLLNVTHALQPFVLEPHREEVENIPKEHKKLDGGVAAAVTTTLIAVCDRLAKIANEPTCWNLDVQNTLEKALGEMYAENTALLRTHNILAHTLAAPHNTFKPTFGTLPDGRFFAFYGDPNTPDECVIGIGPTLETALQNFNAQFKMTSDGVNKAKAPLPVVTVIPNPSKKRNK